VFAIARYASLGIAGLLSCTAYAGDTAALVKLPGVGKKTVERLVVEMRDRLADWEPVAPQPVRRRHRRRTLPIRLRKR
jgi:Holliday junction resolvasome RuvABC DNA-binding subunit